MTQVKSTLQVYWKIRWLRRTLKAMLVLAALLILLPFAMQYGISHQLRKMGAHQAHIDDIDMNLFTGRLVIQKLEFSRADERPARLENLSIDIDMQQLFAGVIGISEFAVDGLNAHIVRHKNDDISINGVKVLDASEKPGATEEKTVKTDELKFSIEFFQMANSTLLYQETGLEQSLGLHKLQVSHLRNWEKQTPALVNADISVNEAALKLNARALLFSDTARVEGHIELSNLKVEDYSKFYEGQISELSARLSVDSEFNLTFGDSLEAEIDSNVTVAHLNAVYKDIHQSVGQLTWQGQTRLSGNNQLSLSGDLAIQQNRTYDNKHQYQLAAFQKMSLKGVHHKAESTRFEQLSIEKLALISDSPLQPEKHKRFVALERLAVTQLVFEPKVESVNIKLISLAGPQASLLLDEKRQLVHLQPLMSSIDGFKSSPGDSSSTNTEKPEEQAPLALQIDKLLLESEGSLNIEDHGVKPVYKTRMSLRQIEIDNISSKEPADIKLALGLGEYTKIDLDGRGLLFNPTQSLNLNAKITQLDLPPVTPYSSAAMGYGMKSGTVDTELEIKLLEHEIDSLIDLKIDSIEIVETDAETAGQISSASGMSIDLALSSLKDSKNVITLKLPVRGNIDEPDFDLSLIINHAVGKAMQSATLSYLQHALQPFGSLVTLFKLAKAAANHISLPPLVFKANSTEFETDQKDLLGKVITVLNERPGLKIKACGIATDADRQAIEAELIQAEKTKLEKERDKKQSKSDNPDKSSTNTPIVVTIPAETITHAARELADQRSTLVKRLIIDQGGLEPSRILNCLSAVKAGEGEKPSVELSL